MHDTVFSLSPGISFFNDHGGEFLHYDQGGHDHAARALRCVHGRVHGYHRCEYARGDVRGDGHACGRARGSASYPHQNVRECAFECVRACVHVDVHVSLP